MTKHFKAIIFDASNTLFFGDGNEFEEASLYSLYYYLWQQGIDLRDEGFSREALWLYWKTIRKQPKGDANHKQLRTTKLDLKDLFTEVETLVLNEQLLAKLEEIYYEPTVAATQALPNMQDILIELQKKYKLAVISNTRSHYFIEESIRRAGLIGFFDVVITSDKVGWRKPDSRIFEVALNHLNLEASQTIMIGDSLEKDIAGARALGMNTIWLSLNSSSDLTQSNVQPSNIQPNYEAKHPLDILQFIEGHSDD